MSLSALVFAFSATSVCGDSGYERASFPFKSIALEPTIVTPTLSSTGIRLLRF